MLVAILLAVIAAMAIAILGWIFKRPRQWLLGMLGRWTLAIRRKLYLARRERNQLAIDRIARHLAFTMNQADGNPDDELYMDWYRYFTGDATIEVGEIHQAHNQRLKDQLESGSYNRRRP